MQFGGGGWGWSLQNRNEFINFVDIMTANKWYVSHLFDSRWDFCNFFWVKYYKILKILNRWKCFNYNNVLLSSWISTCVPCHLEDMFTLNFFSACLMLYLKQTVQSNFNNFIICSKLSYYVCAKRRKIFKLIRRMLYHKHVYILVH